MKSIENFPTRPGRAARERGLSLITTLLFMVAALMLGVSILSVNVMQERSIANTRDRDLAFQAAEAALRDGEMDLLEGRVNLASAFSDDCTNGLCTLRSQRATNPVSLPIHAGFDWGNPAKVRMYGQYSLVGTFPGVAEGPRYVIEKLGPIGTPSGDPISTGIAAAERGYGYRVTARAKGARAETEVILESIYTKR